MTDTKRDAAQGAARLLRTQRILSLGTLHEGAPSVTMAPFAVMQEPLALVLLVSGLASHTKDMVADPRVASMVSEPEREDAPVHSLGRVSIQAHARRVAADDAHHDAARAAYSARFPDMEMLFSLGDFGLFLLEPVAIRVVTGFAQAASITKDTLAAALRGE
jgi:putative heme iron utilization protein